MARSRKGDHPAFEKALERLEEIVEKMETGDLGLDESLALFEEGIRLARTCESRLSDVEKKVEELLEEDRGHLQTVPLDRDEDSLADDEDEADDDDAPF